jgi:hypothetical protein
MSEQFREYAKEALDWALQSKTEKEQKALIYLAQTWALAGSLGRQTRSHKSASVGGFPRFEHVNDITNLVVAGFRANWPDLKNGVPGFGHRPLPIKKSEASVFRACSTCNAPHRGPLSDCVT